MSIDPILAKIGLDSVIACVRGLREKLSEREYKKLIRNAVAELLKEHPDLDVAEAHLLAAEATRSRPSVELTRAKRIFQTVKTHSAVTSRYAKEMPRTTIPESLRRKSAKKYLARKAHKKAVRKHH